MDNDAHKTDIIIHDAIHVLTLDFRLISAQQFAQQHVHQDTKGVIEVNHLVLK